jgi:hypothetical protein
MSKQVTFEVKYKAAVLENGMPKIVDGKEVKENKVGSTTEIQFESYVDALTHYEGLFPGKGESTVIEYLNDYLKGIAIAKERAALTRGPSVARTVSKGIKENTDFAAELATLMAKYKLTQ